MVWSRIRDDSISDGRDRPLAVPGRKSVELERVAVVGLLVAIAAGSLRAQQSVRSLDCQSSFPPDMTGEDLARRFGAQVAISTQVYVGEGFYEEGTVLFADSPDERLEVLWRDGSHKHHPRSVCTRGAHSKWRTPQGIHIGTDLRTIERINGRPFQLAGFAWDGGGGAGTWLGGRLERSSGTACDLALQLEPRPDQLNDAMYKKVLGDHQFLSRHRAMQAINPRVSRICLRFE